MKEQMTLLPARRLLNHSLHDLPISVQISFLVMAFPRFPLTIFPGKYECDGLGRRSVCVFCCLDSRRHVWLPLDFCRDFLFWHCRTLRPFQNCPLLFSPPLDIFRHFPLCVTVDGYFVCSVFYLIFLFLFFTRPPFSLLAIVFFLAFLFKFFFFCVALFLVFCSLLAKSQPMSCGIFK